MIVDGSGRVWAMHYDPAGVAAAVHAREAARNGDLSAALGAGEALEGSDFARLVDGVAIVPVRGLLYNRFSCWWWSYEEIARDLDLAEANDRVETILLDIDSPGGLVAGCGDLAARIRAVRGAKPITAHANGLCASAAYMIGASCDRLVLSSGCMIGSVGTVIEYLDLEPYLEGLGARMIRVVAEQSPNKRLDPESEEGQAEMQALVDAGAEEFIAALVAGRDVSRETILDRFGQGLVFHPEEAIARGMADGLATHNDILAELAGRDTQSSAGPAAAASQEDPMDWASITAAALQEHRPELVEEIGAAAVAADTSANEATARAAGAEAERARILGIEDVAVAGHEDLIAAAKRDGTTTPEAVAVQILQAQKAAGSDALAARQEAENVVGQVPAAPVQADPKPQASGEPQTDEDAVAAWNASADLQAEFPTAETYAAFAKAQRAGRIHRLRRAE